MVFLMSKRGWCNALFTGLLITVALVGRANAQGAPSAGDSAGREQEPAPAQEPTGPARQPPPAAYPAQEAANEGYVDADPEAVETFRPVLEPYGVWVQDPSYGLVWVPNAAVVGPDFTPYVSAGHWALTADGDWLWVSDYAWGWAPFHYGRWVWIPGRGWAWVAGRRYAPAWVVWRVGDPGYAYVGWAPMPPDYYWYGGVAVAVWVSPPPHYVYCHSHHVFTPHVHRHAISGHRAHGIAGRTHAYHRHSASPRPDRHAAEPRWKGPRPSEAGVPPQAVPRTTAKPHPKALAAAKPARASSSPTLHRERTARTSNNASPTLSRRPAARSSARTPTLSAPVYRGGPASAVSSAQRGRPLASQPTGAPSRRVRRPTTLGSQTGAPRARPAPSPTYGRGARATPSSGGPRPQPRATPSRRSPPTYQPPARSTYPVVRGNRASAPRPSAAPSTRQPTYRRPSSTPTYRAPQVRPSRTPVFRGTPQGSNSSSDANQNKKNRGRATGKARGGRRR